MKYQIVFIFIACLFSHATLACSCHRESYNFIEDIELSYKNSHAVVKAIARSVESTNISMDFVRGKTTHVKGELTTFEVTKSWKGISAKNFRTKIATECCLCGLKFEVGKEYLLYLGLHAPLSDSEPKDDSYYSTSICSRSKLIEKAGAEENILDKLTKNKLKH